jgi:hypothetical protein
MLNGFAEANGQAINEKVAYSVAGMQLGNKVGIESADYRE